MNDIIVNGSLSVDVTRDFIALQEALKDLKAQEEAIKAQVIAYMEDNGILKVENDIMSITYIAPTTRESLDSKTLRKDFPEVYDAYARLSPVKASVRIKIK